MPAQKLLIKTSYCILFLILLASIGLNVYQWLRYKRPSFKTTTRSSVEHVSATAKIVPQDRTLKTDPVVNGETPGPDKVKELEYQLAAAEEELEIANNKLAEEVSERQRIFRNMIRQSAIQKANIEYRGLFKKLNISKEDVEKFSEMLADKSLDIDDIFITMSGGTSSGEEVVSEVQKTENDYDRKISEFLGEKNYLIYKAYTDRNTERGVLQGFMDTITPFNRLDDYQTNALIDAMYEARLSVENELGVETSSPVERMKHINEKYFEAGDAVLSPELAEQFKRYLLNIDDMLHLKQP
ncbi:MAG: hypothetical protein GX654_16290 [Desulfatiglans sp.]|nr:hypothetical protein [Desulfatiglans sp.]